MQRIRAAAIALAWGLAAVPASAWADMSVRQYLSIQRAEAAVRPDFALVYLSGVLDGLQAVNAAATARGSALFCIPAGQRMPTVLDLKPGIDAAIEAAAQQRQGFDEYARVVTIAAVGLNTLTVLFPCPGPVVQPGLGAAAAGARP